MVASSRFPVRRQVALTQEEWMVQRRSRARFLADRVANRTPRQRKAARRYTVAEEPRSEAGVDEVTSDDDTRSTRWASYEQLQALNRTLAFDPLTEADSMRLEREASRFYDADGLDRKVCAITDAWTFARSAERMPLVQMPLEAMHKVLSGSPWATDAIQKYYDCSDIDPSLDGMLLSRRGIERDDDGVYIWASSAAMSSLRSTAAALASSRTVEVTFKPPKFSIADGFVAGTYPEIDETTYVERQAIGLVQMRGVVKVVYGGPGNVLQSHLLCWDNRNATIASQIPSVISREQFQLILAGPFTEPQAILIAQRHECSGQRVHDAHTLLRKINPLYADIEWNTAFDAQQVTRDDLTTRLDINDDTDRLVADARSRQSTVARQNQESEDTDDTERRECSVVESETVLVETIVDRNEHESLQRAFENVTGDARRYVARRSSVLLHNSDPRFLELSFPHLLTFGVRGFKTQRQHQYSHRAIVLHYFNLSTNRFAKDPLFKLAMFDYLSSTRVKNSVFLRVGQDPGLATSVMQVSPQQLETAMRNRADQRSAWKRGQTHVPVAESPLATRVLKSIHSSAAKMWGSNEERESMSRKVDAMTIFYGAPSVFWTLTPNPDCSMTCAFWSGCELPNGRPTKLSLCSEQNMPCSSEMARLIMSNTVIQAQYYHVCATILIEILFGWDSKRQRPKAQRGIFGFVEALVYALEQQGRLFVHHHGVAWVAGMPKTQSDWERLLANNDLKNRFKAYCSSIFSAELPVYKTLDKLQCPIATCPGELFPITILKKFKHILKSSVSAPLVAKCDGCGFEFTEKAVVSAIVERHWDQLCPDDRSLSSPQAVEGLRHRFGGLSADQATSNVQLTRLLLKDQIHLFTHTRSCVKGRSSTKCRYRFFRPLVEATEFNKQDEVVHRRRVGNQWLNMFIPLWRRIFHFNMDSRLLWTGQGLQVTRYALQYTMKRQTVLDNVAVVELAFKKRVERETNLATTEYARGIGRLLSLSHATSGVMEIGGPLATAIVLEGEAVSFGCLFERLVVIDGLNLLALREIEAMVVSRDNGLCTETCIGKYIERPRCLEHVSWYDFCTWFRRTNTRATRNAFSCSFSSASTSALRQHLSSHSFKYFDYPRVPEIIGPRLPDATRLEDDDYVEQTELYYRMALLLYHPFRDVTVFLHGPSARDFFTHWRALDDPIVSRALEQHQQYYICLQAAQEYRARPRSASSDSSSDENESCDDDDVLRTSNDAPVSTVSPNTFTLIPAEVYCGEVDVNMDEQADDTPATTDNESAIKKLLYQSISSMSVPCDNTATIVAIGSSITKKQVDAFIKQTPLVVQDTPELHEGTGHSRTRTVMVEAYEHAVMDMFTIRRQPAAEELPAYATINAVSSHYHLNCRQHMAFSLIAAPILSKITRCPIPSEQMGVINFAPFIITGAGGTGKSRVIAAVKALAAAWNCPSAIMVVASTGIAAASLNGSTMHSSVGLGINPQRLPKHVVAPSDAVLQRWAPVVCVIADELSMIDLAFFGLWEESLRYVKDNREEEFGGMLAVLMFDHCQLSTVTGAAMYKTSSGTVPLTPLQDTGRALYRSIRKAIYLTENMRFSHDPEWGEWLSSARLGRWLSPIRSFIASLPQVGMASLATQQGIIQTISTDNATRAAINDIAIQTAVETFRSSRKIYVIPAKLSRQLSPLESAIIRTLPDNKTGNIPVFFQVYIGMPVRIKANQCVLKGVVNGACGTVHHIDWPPHTGFTLQSNSTWLAGNQPTNVYVDLTNSSSPIRFPGLPSDWPNSVMPIYMTTGTVQIKGPALSIKGYPIVPAFGTTVHGVQGETRHAVAVTNLRPPSCRRVDPHALYVSLSRLQTRYGLYWIGERPSPEDFDFFRPSEAVLFEDDRLKRLSDATISAFNALANSSP